jgi:3-oxoacyl-[acyl-carrier protein] reductase
MSLDARVLRGDSRGADPRARASATRLGSVAKPTDPAGMEPKSGCALVTGASRGIGAATARALAEDGWPVGVNYHRDSDAAERVASQIRAAGGWAMPLCANVTSEPAGEEMLARLTEELGPLRVLVNNAGMTADGLSMRLRDEDWSRTLDLNLTAAFRLTRRVLAPMIRERHGRIINVASVVGLRANPGQANYAAAKAGLIAFTRTVAVEVARRGITVNAVAPGLIETELTREIASDRSGNGLLDAVPARRPGRPEEVADCIRFLASDQASYVTGALLTVDGGMSA